MKLYIYEYVGELTDSWHDGGGLAIITDGDPLEAWRATVDRDGLAQTLPVPTYTATVADDAEPRVFVFPDAGCC